jgi:hypothetical protein
LARYPSRSISRVSTSSCGTPSEAAKPLGGRQGRRHGGRGGHPPIGRAVGRARRGREQEGRVRPAREGHHHRTEVAQLPVEPVDPALQLAAGQPGDETGQIGKHHVGGGQLLRQRRPGRDRYRHRARGARAHDVERVVADEDRRSVQRRRLAAAGELAGDVRGLEPVGEAGCPQAGPREVGALRGDHDHPATEIAYRAQRLGGARQGRASGHTVLEVERAVALDGGPHLVGRTPARELLGERDPDPRQHAVDVDRDAELLGEQSPGPCDARAGVEQRQVEIEAHQQR